MRYKNVLIYTTVEIIYQLMSSYTILVLIFINTTIFRVPVDKGWQIYISLPPLVGVLHISQSLCTSSNKVCFLSIVGNGL